MPHPLRGTHPCSWLEDTDATNEYINDGNVVQPLTAFEIEALKKSGIHASVCPPSISQDEQHISIGSGNYQAAGRAACKLLTQNRI